MNCHYCGTELAENTLFCFYCGTKQHAPEEAPEIPEEEIPVDPIPEEDWFPDLGDLSLEPELPEPEPEPVYREAPREDVVYEAVPARHYSAPKPLPQLPTVKKPRIQLPTRRSLAKMFFLGILTLGIYPTVIWSRMAGELNITASRYDGERTMPYLAMLLLAPLTLGIYLFVWNHHFCRRVGMELRRRKLDFTFDVSDYWLWNILGSLILVGPFVYTFKLLRAMNRINEDFNNNG